MNTQDVLLIIGKPDTIYFKEEDAMQIYRDDEDCIESEVYIWNYLDLGLDFVFIDHVLKKIVFQNNLPGHYDFGKYNRCCFVLISGDIQITNDTKVLCFMVLIS
jgi:hypothetical protein